MIMIHFLFKQQTLQQPQQQNQVMMNDDQQMMGNAQQGNQQQQPQGAGVPTGPQQRPQPVSSVLEQFLVLS